MFTRPDELTDTDIVRCVADGWGLRAKEVEYAAVGFGSHHWHVSSDRNRWFLNVDDLDARPRRVEQTRVDASHRLSAALTVARSLCDGGLDFVVAPVRNRNQGVVHPIDDRYVAALYEYVDGESHSWSPYPTRADRLAVLDRIIAIHTSNIETSLPRRDDFTIPGRDQLETALTEADRPWACGPYADRARTLLRAHGDALLAVLAQYDDLVDVVAHRSERAVLTHGEPHRGNTINTSDGVVLIDWDTALIAPPERDLWMLIDEDPQIAADYTERTGVPLDDAALRLYRLWWDLCEISLFSAEFRAPHADTEDTRVAWAALSRFLDPARWSQLF